MAKHVSSLKGIMEITSLREWLESPYSPSSSVATCAATLVHGRSPSFEVLAIEIHQTIRL